MCLGWVAQHPAHVNHKKEKAMNAGLAFFFLELKSARHIFQYYFFEKKIKANDMSFTMINDVLFIFSSLTTKEMTKKTKKWFY